MRFIDMLPGYLIIIVYLCVDIVERAYLISKNKSVFFGQEALAEANRYVAALYTAIAYNQPRCVELILSAVSRRDAAPHSFYVADLPTLQNLEAAELAHTLGIGLICRLLSF